MSIAERPGRVASARWSGAAIGAGAAAVLLIVAALALASGEDVSALKALVPVWLAALPVLGIGALVGSLIATAIPRRTTAARAAGMPPALEIPPAPESTASASVEHRREEHTDVL